MENRIAIISTNSHTNAELAVMPNCSGVNLKKKKRDLALLRSANLVYTNMIGEFSYLFCVPITSPATRMYVTKAITVELKRTTNQDSYGNMRSFSH